MIHFFNGRGRVLFFPVKWANSVVRWVAGVHSSTGTIKIANTLNPGEKHSASFDIDIPAASKKMTPAIMREIEANGGSTRPDSTSLVVIDGRISIGQAWLDDYIDKRLVHHNLIA